MEYKTVSDLFPSKFLKAEDLQGKTFSLKVKSVSFEKLHGRFGEGDQVKAVLWFQGAQKGLILNKTQALALAEIAGTEEFSQWGGMGVALRPGRAQNGKPTIVITRAGEM